MHNGLGFYSAGYPATGSISFVKNPLDMNNQWKSGIPFTIGGISWVSEKDTPKGDSDILGYTVS